MPILQPQAKPANKPRASLDRQACPSCGAGVIFCRIAGRRIPIAVEFAPRGDGDIGISDDLFGGGVTAIQLATTTSRYRLHGPRCPGPRAFSRVGGRKTK